MAWVLPSTAFLVRSTALGSLSCAAAGCHTILVRKGILLENNFSFL
jgi:hypothetical protein